MHDSIEEQRGRHGKQGEPVKSGVWQLGQYRCQIEAQHRWQHLHNDERWGYRSSFSAEPEKLHGVRNEVLHPFLKLDNIVERYSP